MWVPGVKNHNRRDWSVRFVERNCVDAFNNKNQVKNPGFPIREQLWKETPLTHFPNITAIRRGRLFTHQWQPMLQMQPAFLFHCGAIPTSPTNNKILGFILVPLTRWNTVFSRSGEISPGAVNIGKEEEARWKELMLHRRKYCKVLSPVDTAQVHAS